MRDFWKGSIRQICTSRVTILFCENNRERNSHSIYSHLVDNSYSKITRDIIFGCAWVWGVSYHQFIPKKKKMTESGIEPDTTMWADTVIEPFNLDRTRIMVRVANVKQADCVFVFLCYHRRKILCRMPIAWICE